MASVPPPLLPLLTLLASAGGGAPEIDVGDVSRAPDACPSRAQIADALEGHMPGVLARIGRELDPNVLHLGLAISATGAAHVTLTDATGGLRLERDLELPKPPPPPVPSPAGAPAPAPARDRSSDCAAFADTLALIVERYMRHLGYHEPPPPALMPPPPPAPPPPPPPPAASAPRALLGVGLSLRPPWNAPTRWGPEVGLDVRVGTLSLAASAGYDVRHDAPVPMTGGAGTFALSALSARVALGWVVPLAERLSLIPALAAGADFVRAETSGIGLTRRSSAVEPTVEGGLSLTWLVTQRFWIGARAFQGVDLRPEEFYVTTDAAPSRLTLAVTPRAYVRAGVDFGVTLGKN
jgi:hypothetical protein